MAEVRFEHVTKSYTPGTNVITDLNLVVNDGEFLVLVGPSGCGKSTALRMIAGLEAITEGDLFIGTAPGQRHCAQRPRHCDGLSELRPLSPHERL